MSTLDVVDVVVVGGGVAGTLAALDVKARGGSVAVIAEGEGGSGLTLGPWDAREPGAAATLERLSQLVPGLLRRPPSGRALLVSERGHLRAAAAHDPAQLDLGSSSGARIAVASLAGHPSFDGRHLARGLDQHAVATGERRRHAAIEIDFLRRGRDRVLHPHELAAELDLDPEDERRGRDARYVLSEAIRAALGGLSFDAVLVPAILGYRSDDVRSELEASVGLPIGEAVAELPGAAGGRLIRRLRAALLRADIDVHRERAERVTHEGQVLQVHRLGGPPIAGRALVLATGKLLGGGITLANGDRRESLLGAALGGGGEAERGVITEEHGQITQLPAALMGAPIFAAGAILQGFDGSGRRRGLVDVAESALRASEAAHRPPG